MKSGRALFWGATLLAAFVHWIPEYPPQIDLAQHAGQIRFLRDWLRPEFPYREILELNFFTPYLPAYLLGAALAWVVSPVLAVKILWSIGAFGTVYVSVQIRRRLGGSGEWDWLLLPGLFGTTFVWGFLTFQFTIPLGLLVVDNWLIYLDRPSPRRGALLGAALIALFFCHSLVTAWVLLVAGLMLLSSTTAPLRDVPRLLVRGLPLISPLPVIGVWLTATSETAQAQSALYWGSVEERLLGFFPDMLGGPLPNLAAVVGITVLTMPYLSGQRLQENPVLRVPFVVTLALLLAAPFRVFGNSFTYSRFFILLGPSLVIAMAGAPRLTGILYRFRAAVPVLCLGWVLTIGASMVAFSIEQRDFGRVLKGMSEGSRTLSVVQSASSRALGHPKTYLYFPVWHQAERGGLVEFSFASFYPMLVRFKPEYSGYVPHRFGASPTLDGAQEFGNVFDYILVRMSPEQIVGAEAVGRPLLAREGQWLLYGVDNP